MSHRRSPQQRRRSFLDCLRKQIGGNLQPNIQRTLETLEERRLLAANPLVAEGEGPVYMDMKLSAPVQDQLLKSLSTLDTAADRLTTHPTLNRQIPGAGQSLNDLVDEGGVNRDWGDLLQFEQAVSVYLSKFDPTNENYDPSTEGELPTAFGLRDAIQAQINVLDAAGYLGREGAPSVMVTGGLNAASNQLQFDIAVAADRTETVAPNLDSLGPDWTDLSIDFSDSEQITVGASVDVELSFGMSLAQPEGVNPFFELGRFDVSASINEAGETLDYTIGDAIQGSMAATEFRVDADVEIGLAGAGKLVDRLSVRTTGTDDLAIDFGFSDASLYGTTLASAQRTFVDSEIFDFLAATSGGNVASIDLNLSGQALIDGLEALADWADAAIESDTDLATPLPLTGKTIGEILLAASRPRNFVGSAAVTLSTPVVVGQVRQFTATLVGVRAASQGIKSGSQAKFLATTGDRFTATVVEVDGNQVTLEYDAARLDLPLTTNPEISFEAIGSVGGSLRAALEQYHNSDDVPTLGQVLDELTVSLGLDLGAVTLVGNQLQLSATFTPAALTVPFELEFGDAIDGLGFDPSDELAMTVEPTFALPLTINLTPGVADVDRISVDDNTAPEVEVKISTNLSNPSFLASSGFVRSILKRADGVLGGINFEANLDLSIEDTVNNDGSTVAELLAGLTTLVPSVQGEYDIAGLSLQADSLLGAAGEAIIRTTSDGSNDGVATFTGFAELADLFESAGIDVDNTTNPIETFSGFAPEDMVAFVISLGDSLEDLLSKLDVPGGIPFVQDAVSTVAKFAEQTGAIAERLFENATLTAPQDISVTTGVLSADASFALRIEDEAPVFVTVTAEETANNQKLDDLLADLNAALNRAGLGGKIEATRGEGEAANRVVLQVVDASVGSTLDVSTIQITGPNEAPSSGQISEDVELTFTINTENLEAPATVNVTVSADNTTNNTSLEDLARTLNTAMEVDVGDGTLLSDLVVVQVIDEHLRVSAVDSTTLSLAISGGEVLGFAADQESDANTAATEMGLTNSQTANAESKVSSIQGFMDVVNEFIAPAVPLELSYDAPNQRVLFDFKLEEVFEQPIDLNFGKSIDLGFADLNLAGGANAKFVVGAGFDLHLGLDLSQVDSGDSTTVDGTTPLPTLMRGRGVELKVGVVATDEPTQAAGTLTFGLGRYGQADETVSLTLTANELADNATTEDLMFDINDQLEALDQPVRATLLDGKLALLVEGDATVNDITIISGAFGFAPNQSGDQADLVITTASGNVVEVNLDGSETLQDLKLKIEAATTPAPGENSEVLVTFVGDQIQIQDLTASVEEGRLSISAASTDLGTSSAAAGLGIVQVAGKEDSDETPFDDSTTVRGDHLLLRSNLDRFFIDTANSSVYANAKVLADDIDLTASLGLLELGVVDGQFGNGDLDASTGTGFAIAVGLSLPDAGDDPDNNPATHTPLRLSDFRASAYQEKLADTQPSFTYGGSAAFPLSIPLLPGESPTITLNLQNDPADPLRPNLDIDAPNLSELIGDFKNLSMADIAGMLRDAVDMLRDSDISGLNTTIPVVNQTPNEMLAFTDGLLAAAEKLLANVDVAKLKELRDELLAELDKVNANEEQLAELEAAFQQVSEAIASDHTYSLSITTSLGSVQTPPIPAVTSPVDLEAILSEAIGVEDSVTITSEAGSGYEFTFDNSLGDVSISASSESGLTLQFETTTEGILNSVSEVQTVELISTGGLIASLRNLQTTIENLGDAGVDVTAVEDIVTEMRGGVVSTENLGSFLTDLLQAELGLPITVDVEFLDANGNAAGYEAALKLSLGIDAEVNRSVDFDLSLDDFGPITIGAAGQLEVMFGGSIDLDLGFNFATLTPYVFDSTHVDISADIAAPLEVMASIGGFEAGLTGTTTLDASIGVDLRDDIVPSDGNAIGAIPIAQLFSLGLGSAFDFALAGELNADFDANLAGVEISDAIQVDFDINDHAPAIDYSNLTTAVNNYLNSLTDLGSMSLDQLIGGTRAVLDVIESGLTSDLLTSMPLLGDGVDLGASFIGKLESMLDEFESLINSTDDSVDALVADIQTLIFDSLGPAGAGILKLNPLFHDDPSIDDANEVPDSRDVEVSLSDLSSTPAQDVEFFINLNLAGRDIIEANFDLGLDAVVFEFEAQGGVQLEWAYDFSLGFGVNLRDGFFFQLNENTELDAEGFPLPADASRGKAELALNAEISLQPGTSLKGELFFLNLIAQTNPVEDYNGNGIADELNEAVDGVDYNRDGDMNDLLVESDVNGDGRLSKGTSLKGEIFVDIDNPDDDVKNRLSFGELTGAEPLFAAGVRATASADLALQADTDAAALPAITTDLTMDWLVGYSTTVGFVGGAPTMALNDVSLDLGSFFDSIAGPAFDMFARYTASAKPVIDFLRAEVPGFSDLSTEFGGPKITFLDLGAYGSGNADKVRKARKALETIEGILKAVNQIKNFADADGLIINFGTFQLSGDLTDKDTKIKAPETTNTGGNISSAVFDQIGTGSTKARNTTSTLKKLNRSASSGGHGLNIPLLSDPSNAFKLFTGETVDLIQWDIPTLDLNLGFSAKFGPIGPTPIFAKVGGSVDAKLDFSLGFDTRGISTTGYFLDGLYFGDLANVTTGRDIDEIEFNLRVNAGVGIDLFVAGVYLTGGVRGNLGFDWNDLDGNGKLYFDELATLAQIRTRPYVPGACVFDASGRLNAEIGVEWWATLASGYIPIIDTELFNFNYTCDTGSNVAEVTRNNASFANGTLRLNAGPYAGDRSPGVSRDNAETFEVTKLPSGEIQVTYDLVADNGSVTKVSRQYTGVQQIYFNGGAGNDKITIDESVTLPVTLIGGSGNDTLIGGSGNTTFAGGTGNDTLISRGGAASQDRYLFGNNWGVDTITDAGGHDTLDFSSVTVGLNIQQGDTTTASYAGNRIQGPGGAALTGIDGLVGSSATDTLTVTRVIGNGSENVWTVDKPGGGNINGLLQFTGFENLTGGDPNDRFAFAGGSIAGQVNGAGGENTLDFESVSSPVTVDLSRSQVSTSITLPFFGELDFNLVNAFDNIDEVVGSGSTDTLIGPNGNATWDLTGLNSGSVEGVQFKGIENLIGSNGNDTFVIAADGKLTGKLRGTKTPGAVDGDTIDLSPRTTTQTVQVTGRNRGSVAGAVNFDGIESVLGGNASDHFVISPAAGLTGTTDGGLGDEDHLDYSLWSTRVTVDFAAGTNQVGNVAGMEFLTGGAAGDVLTGNASSNRIIGLGGGDQIDGRGGNNLLIGDSARLTPNSGPISEVDSIRTLGDFAGNDILTAGDGDNIILAGSGDDAITTGNGNNVVGGDQVLVTRSGGQMISLQSLRVDEGGHDSITVGSGDDLVVAGDGNDTVGDGGGQNVIVGDRGRILLENGLVTLAIGQVSILSGRDIITSGDGRDAIIAGGNADTVSAGAGENYILGDDGQIAFVGGLTSSSTLEKTSLDGDDVITTLGGRDIVYTGDGDNTVTAGEGDDDVFAGIGIDTIEGQGGNDFLVGDLGDDEIRGGAGDDVVFGGLALGTRGDYELGTDDFTLPPEFANNEALHATGYTPSINITPQIVGGLSIDGVEGDGRDIIDGNDGNDVLFGGFDVDEVRGGAGVDYVDAGGSDDSVVEGNDGDDVVRGGAGNDTVRGGEGIDQVYGDAGDDLVYGEAGTNGNQTGQRLYGGTGRDTLYAYGLAGETSKDGDHLFGGGGADLVYGSPREEVLRGGSGDDYLGGDELVFAGGEYVTNPNRETSGADDELFGDSGDDQVFGHGGNDTAWGGGGTDYIVGGKGSDIQYGGEGIDLFVLYTDADAHSDQDTIDGHFGNSIAGDVADDNATDILVIDGTQLNDEILIGRQTTSPHLATVLYGSSPSSVITTVAISVDMLDADGNLLVEQFRISGLAGNDKLGFYTDQAVQSGVLGERAGFETINLDSVAEKSRDWVGVFDGNSGNDTLVGSAGRDRMDGGQGDDEAYGFAGDDRLWGDGGEGSTADHDVLYAGQGNDDLVGGQGTNELYAWSFNPQPELVPPGTDENYPDRGFGVFVDEEGALFNDDGDLNNNGIFDPDDSVSVGPVRLARNPEVTGLNRMLGSQQGDLLFGGTTLDFMYGNGGDDELYRADGTTFESADGGVAGEEWKEYARESDQVWYIGGSNTEDEIRVDFVTEPGLLTDHHVISRRTNNNGNNTFNIDVRLDFSATDESGNEIWSADDLAFKLDQLQSVTDPAARSAALADVSSQASAPVIASDLLSTLLPPEGDFLVILVDALGGDDDIDIGPTVQKSVWIDAGDGNDVVTIGSGNSILVDKSERSLGTTGTISRNDIPRQAFDLLDVREDDSTIAFDGTELPDGAIEFNGLSIDSPTDVDWYAFTLSEAADATSTLELASGSPIDELLMEIFNVADVDPLTGEVVDGASALLSSTSSGDRSSIENLSSLASDTRYLLKVSSPNVVPTLYDLRFSLDGPPPTDIPSVDLSLREDTTRRDVILGGNGDDILQGGGGEDWIFGNAGNDVLTGGTDRGASDLLFGGPGDDTFQIIPDQLPLLGNQPNTNFAPGTETYITTASDQYIGGEGTDRVLYLGGDKDPVGRDVNDFAAMRYNTELHRYEFTSLVWDIDAQAFQTTTDSAGRTILEQHYLFYQTRDIEQTQFELGAGDDVVHLGGEFQFLPVDGIFDASEYEAWGLERGDLQQGALEPIFVFGGEGNDLLVGSNGDDRLDGGPGNDTIAGEGGNDIILGGEGDDQLSGANLLGEWAPAAIPTTDLSDRSYEYSLASPLSFVIESESKVSLEMEFEGADQFESIADGLAGEIENDRLSRFVSLGDFNGDGHEDFVAGGTSTSYVLLGPVQLNGVSSVADQASFVISHAAIGRPAEQHGDLNGDGLGDLILVNRTRERILDSSGNFNGEYAAPNTIVTVVWGAERPGNDRVWTRELADSLDSNNTRTLTLDEDNISFDTQPFVAAFNFDDDSRDDLVVFTEQTSKNGRLGHVFAGDDLTSNLTATDAVAVYTPLNIGLPQPTAGLRYRLTLLGDVDGDGIDDLGFDDYSKVTLVGSTNLVSGTNPFRLAQLSDLNNDGYDDIGITHPTHLDIFFGSQSGINLASPDRVIDGPYLQPMTGDFNGDGNTDLATISGAGERLATSTTDVYYSIGQSAGQLSASDANAKLPFTGQQTVPRNYASFRRGAIDVPNAVTEGSVGITFHMIARSNFQPVGQFNDQILRVAGVDAIDLEFSGDQARLYIQDVTVFPNGSKEFIDEELFWDIPNLSNDFHAITLTIRNADASAELFIDGKSMGNHRIEPFWTDGMDESGLYMPATFVGPPIDSSNDLDLDELAVYRRGISTLEAIQIFTDGVANASITPDHHYLINESGGVFVDSIGGQNATFLEGLTDPRVAMIDFVGSAEISPHIDLNGDGVDDLVLPAGLSSNTESDAEAGRIHAVYGIARSTTIGNQFHVLENFSVAGSGSFVVDRGTGLPELFDDGGTPFSLSESEQRWFQFTTLGDGQADNLIYLDGAVTGDLIDASGSIVAEGQQAFDLRGLTAGTYYLDVTAVVPTDLVIQFAAPRRGQAGDASDRDRIVGGPGRDTLDGGGGLDHLLGQDGTDTFVGEPIEARDAASESVTSPIDVGLLSFNTTPQTTDPVVEIENAGLRAAIHRHLGRPVTDGDRVHSDLYASELASITFMGTLFGAGIDSLAGIENLPNLRVLEIGGNPALSDITPLQSLTNLEQLYARNTSIDAASSSTLATLDRLPQLQLLIISAPSLSQSNLVFDEQVNVSINLTSSEDWRVIDRDGNEVASGSGNSVAFSTVDDGRYLAQRQPSGTSFVDWFPIIVRNVAPSIVSEPALVNVLEGQTITLGAREAIGSSLEVPVLIDGAEVDRLQITDPSNADVLGLNLAVKVIDPAGSVRDLAYAAIEFNEQVLEIDSDVFDGRSSLTTAFWLKTTSAALASPQTIMSVGVDEAIVLKDATTLTVKVAGTEYEFTVPSFADGAYHHVAVVRDAENSVLRIFVDGVESTNNHTIAFDPLSATPGTALVGQQFKSPGASPLVGSMDELAVWDRPLTAEEILIVHADQFRTSDGDLIGYWPMNAGGGTVVADRSRYGRDARIIEVVSQRFFYGLKNSYEESENQAGGPSITPAGGTLTANGYVFEETQGPSLADAVNAEDYSIEFEFELDSISSWRKVLDFKNLGANGGLYQNGGQLRFRADAAAVVNGPANALSANQRHKLKITRDGESQVVRAWVDDVFQFEFEDTEELAVFSSANRIIHFLRDDTVFGNSDPSGTLFSVRINETLASPQWTSDVPAVTASGAKLLNNGDYVFRVTARDDDGGFVTQDVPFMVGNVAPGVGFGSNLLAPDSERFVGEAIRSTASHFSDPGVEDQLAYLWEVTNDNAQPIQTGSGFAFEFTPQYAGHYTLSLTVRDEDGGVSEPDVRTYEVKPVVTIERMAAESMPENAVQGNVVTLSSDGSSPVAPAGLRRGTDRSVTREYSWQVTREGAAITLPNNVASARELKFLPTQAGNYTATLTITDIFDDGTSTSEIANSSTFDFTVDAAAPISIVTPTAASQEGDVLEFSLTGLPELTDNAVRSVTWNVTGGAFEPVEVEDQETYRFIPTDDGEYTIAVEVTDTLDGMTFTRSAPNATLTIENATPALVLDGVAGHEGSPVTLTAEVFDAGVNDSQTFVIHWGDGSADSSGSVVAGRIAESHTYVQDGSYTASITITDGISERTVTTQVEIRNVAPVATDDSEFSIAANAMLENLDVLGNDSDAGLMDLLSLFSFDALSEQGASISLAGGLLTYDPRAATMLLQLPQGQSISDTFTYVVRDDSGELDTGTVLISVTGVNDAPQAAEDRRAILANASPLKLNVLDNDSDVDAGDVLRLAIVNGSSDATTLGNYGTLTWDASGAANYTLNTGNEDVLALRDGQSLTETFNLLTSDVIGLTASSQLAITIRGINDAPVAVADMFSTPANQILIGNEGGVAANDFDPDRDDAFAVTAVNGETSQVGVQFQLPSGALLRVKHDGDYEYDPNFAFVALPVGENATDSFTYTLTDDSGASHTATVTIRVEGVNDAPQGIRLSNNSISANAVANQLVGSLTTQDVDLHDAHSYAVVGTSPFGIAGTNLVVVDPAALLASDSHFVKVTSTDAAGLSITQVFQVMVTLAPDTTAPVSSLLPLPPQAFDLLIPISVGGMDPAGGPNSQVSGIKEYEIYVSEDAGAFTLFATLPASGPLTTEFLASSNHNYFFRTIAIDFAGNTETKTSIDAQISVGDFDAPETRVTAATANASGLFQVSMTGTDSGGGGLVFFDVYVSVDGGVAQLIGTTSAGTPDGSGDYSALVSYQGITDGRPHNYRFFSIGRDSFGNIESAPRGRMSDIVVSGTFADLGLQATGIDVQLGSAQRSFIRNVDVLFNAEDGITDLLAAGRVAVERFDLDAVDVTPGTGAAITDFTTDKVGDRLRLDFGSNGITDATNSNFGDGMYRVLVDLDGDGNFNGGADGLFEFHRILGDANGDALVDSTDADVVLSQLGQAGANLQGDLDGNGSVDFDDYFAALDAQGRELADELKLLLDD